MLAAVGGRRRMQCSSIAHTKHNFMCCGSEYFYFIYLVTHTEPAVRVRERERERQARKQPKTEEEELENGKRNCESCDQAKRSRRRGHEIYSPEARRIRERNEEKKGQGSERERKSEKRRNVKTFAHSTVRSSTRPRPAAEQQGKTEDPFFPSHHIQHTHCCSRINKEHETSDSTSVERFVIPTLQCCYVFGMLHAVGMF